VTYTNADARQQLLDQVAAAAEDIGLALANLTEAYEQLDDSSAQRLEDQLFRPLQLASGQAQRTYAEFAGRYRLPTRTFEAAQPHVREHNAKGIIENAAAIVARADQTLATLQDSMLPIDVGDPQLRAGLEQVRVLLSDIGRRSREVTRTVGR
jgi:hypothetical protein